MVAAINARVLFNAFICFLSLLCIKIIQESRAFRNKERKQMKALNNTLAFIAATIVAFAFASMSFAYQPILPVRKVRLTA
jgi:hypothetical protein